MCRSAAEVAEAIRTMVVRGAPAIGIAAAYGHALAAARGEDLDAAERVLRASRPTAVNLGWALDEMRRRPVRRSTRAAFTPTRSSAAGAMGAHAAPAPAGTRALTHCNAGGLATGGYGTALGALLAAWERDRSPRLGRRDAAAAAGRATHRVGARDGRHPAHRDRRLGRGVADGAGRGRLRLHRRRPNRRERRHRQQDRHLRPGGAGARTTACRSTSWRRPRPSISRRATGDEIPIEERDAARGDGAVPGARTPPSTSRRPS